MDFTKIYNEYENTKNVCQFSIDYQQNNAATRFLLIRSLDKNNLKDIVDCYSEEKADSKDNLLSLTQKAYNSRVTIKDLILYIESKRVELIEQRETELSGLQDILAAFPVVNCGVRNDKVDDIVKSFVRNKSLKTLDELTTELDGKLLPRIKQYSMWSYYNQTSNDIIELFFLKHNKVIPTLRKIHDIDFFLKIGEDIIPFDLKFTHISDSYFDLVSKGITRNQNSKLHDDFCENNIGQSETGIIKDYYKKVKLKLKLPNFKDLEINDKNEICNQLLLTGNADAVKFVNMMKQNHKNYVPCDSESLHQLEWWNYKDQGERLFCNNNRLFVFLAYTNEFVDGRGLKGKTKEIGKKITDLLDNLTESDIHTVKYHYDKEQSCSGDYTALSISTIYSE